MQIRTASLCLTLTFLAISCGDDDDGGGVDAGTTGGSDAGVSLDGGVSTDDSGMSGTGLGATGEACENASQCASGQCESNLFGLLPLPGGYCTETCGPRMGCSGDAICVTLASVCAATCTVDSDCRMDEGYMCTPVSGAGTVCIPPVSIPDGGITFPDGGFPLPDGGLMFPDGGIIIFPDGGFGLPDGGLILPDGGLPGL